MSTTLKTLTDTAYDSVEGYRKAAERAESPALRQALTERGEKRQQTVDKLNAELERRGEELTTEGTLTGELHQAWLGIADAFENGDEAAAERVEEGEDYLKRKFESALEEDDLDVQEREVITECYNEVCEGERFGDMIAKQYD